MPLRRLIDIVTSRYRAHRAAAWLAGSAYAVNGSRAVAALLLRLVLDPVAVGVVNGVNMLTALLAPVSLGSIYGVMRELPAAPEADRPRLASRAFAASTIESIFVAIVVSPFVIPLLVPTPFGGAVFWLVVFLTIIVRLIVIQESILLARAEFATAIRVRLVRALEPIVGIAGTLLSATPFAYLSGVGLNGVASLAWRRRAYFPPGLGFRGFWREGLALLRKVDRYNWQVSLDRIAVTLANYVDAAVVVAIAGPATLAGYYLGVNIRGVMSNVPSAIFWQRWSSSVATFESTGVDRYTSVRFLSQLWVLMLALLGAAAVVLWLAVTYLIPAYAPHFRVAVLAAMLAVPMGIAAMLRGRRMLDRRVGLLVWFSVLRVTVFGALLWTFGRDRIQHDPALIALAGYLAVALECIVNAGDVALHVRRPQLLLLVAVLVILPALAFLL